MHTVPTTTTEESIEMSSVPIRVLLVDDIPENLLLLEEVLRDQGYETISVTSGVEAIQQLEINTIHAIVADAMMPAMDGFQLCKEVKQSAEFSKIPFIIYTGNYVDKEDQSFARAIGVDAYVMKYDGLTSLVQSVNDLTRQFRGREGVAIDNRSLKELIAPLNIDGHMFLERHHAIIVKKLEEKMVELQMYAETLSRKNREIQASEARYRNLFEHASIGIFVLDRETGKILDVNGEGLALLGYSGDEMLTIVPLSFVQEDEVRQTILKSENFFSMEASFKRKDGALVEVELGAGPFAEQNNSQVLLHVLDITDQKRMREHLLQSEKMAFMGRLAASIAHDIRNPLAAITLNLQYVSKRLPTDFKDKGSIDFALEGAHRIGKVIEDTLNLARATPPKVQPESINGIVNTAKTFLTTACSQKNILLETQLDPTLPSVFVEAKQIQQVILNLIQNAIDVAPEKSTVTVSTCLMEDLHSRDSQQKNKVAVVILDRGPGISSDAMKHLFEPFFTTKRGGTGLGLALSKQIMDKHKGEIRIEPAVGGGTIAHLIFSGNN